MKDFSLLLILLLINVLCFSQDINWEDQLKSEHKELVNIRNEITGKNFTKINISKQYDSLLNTLDSLITMYNKVIVYSSSKELSKKKLSKKELSLLKNINKNIIYINNKNYLNFKLITISILDKKNIVLDRFPPEFRIESVLNVLDSFSNKKEIRKVKKSLLKLNKNFISFKSRKFNNFNIIKISKDSVLSSSINLVKTIEQKKFDDSYIVNPNTLTQQQKNKIKELAKLIDTIHSKLISYESDLKISFTDKKVFPTGEFELNKTQKDSINQFVKKYINFSKEISDNSNEIVKTYLDVKVNIIGYADKQGFLDKEIDTEAERKEANKTLSQDRANSIATYIKGKIYKLSSDTVQFKIIGKGEELPDNVEDNGEKNDYRRRVVLIKFDIKAKVD